MFEQLSLLPECAYSIDDATQEEKPYRYVVKYNDKVICGFLDLAMCCAFIRHKLAAELLGYKTIRESESRILADYRKRDDEKADKERAKRPAQIYAPAYRDIVNSTEECEACQ